MRAALGAGDGVDLVDNDRVHLAEGFPRLGRQHQEEGFRGGDEDIRRVAEQRAAVSRRRVPGPDAHGNERGGQVQALGGLRDADQRRAEVAFDVDAESLQRGNVQHAGLPRGRLPLYRRPAPGLGGRVQAGQGLGLGGGGDEQPVQGPEERGERLAGAGGGDDEGVRAGGDGIPRTDLGRGGRGKSAQEPVPGRPAEPAHGVGRMCAAGELLPLHSSIMPYPTDTLSRA